jgi:hypothetical protein
VAVVVPARSRVEVGPVRFAPLGDGPAASTLYIKNNLTILEAVRLRGTVRHLRTAVVRFISLTPDVIAGWYRPAGR